MSRIKELVIEWLIRAPEYWEAADALDVWKARVTACDSVADLIAVFAD